MTARSQSGNRAKRIQVSSWRWLDPFMAHVPACPTPAKLKGGREGSTSRAREWRGIYRDTENSVSDATVGDGSHHPRHHDLPRNGRFKDLLRCVMAFSEVPLDRRVPLSARGPWRGWDFPRRESRCTRRERGLRRHRLRSLLSLSTNDGRMCALVAEELVILLTKAQGQAAEKT